MRGKKLKKIGRPENPEIGRLYYEPVTGTMRQWDGKKWAEISGKQISEAVKKICEKDNEKES